jgi:hypothetical protein
VLLERGDEVLPRATQRRRRGTGQDEPVDGAEQTKPGVPALVLAEDRCSRLGIVGEVLGQPGVDRRAERLELLRLPAEDVA